MGKSDSLKDRRQYQRVLVEPSKALTVEVAGFGPTLVFDMSYSGAAFAQPKDKKIEKVEETVTIVLKTEVDNASIPAKVVRVNPEVVAVEFDDIDPAARVIIDRVVTDRIVGLNMSLIDSKHYNAHAQFSHWYHGPRETNIYLWWTGTKLEKAQMDTDKAVLIFEDDSFLFENKGTGAGGNTLNNQQIALKAHAILQQMESDEMALIQFKEMLAKHVQS